MTNPICHFDGAPTVPALLDAMAAPGTRCCTLDDAGDLRPVALPAEIQPYILCICGHPARWVRHRLYHVHYGGWTKDTIEELRAERYDEKELECNSTNLMTKKNTTPPPNHQHCDWPGCKCLLAWDRTSRYAGGNKIAKEMTRDRVLALLAKQKSPIGPREIAAALHFPLPRTRVALTDLVRQGRVEELTDPLLYWPLYRSNKGGEA